MKSRSAEMMCPEVAPVSGYAADHLENRKNRDCFAARQPSRRAYFLSGCGRKKNDDDEK